MDLKFADGTSQTCILKDYDADSWGNNTVHDYDIPQCKLQHARTLDDLRKADIILVYDGDSRKHAPESEDNWDVNEVKVTAQDFVQHSYQCLIDAAGSPLVRLKAIPHNEELVTDSEASGSFDVSQTPSTC